MRAGQLVLRRLETQRISSTTFERADEAVAWLGAVQAQDYLGRDFAWWSGLKLADARHATLLAGELIREELFDGDRYWSASDDSARVEARRGTHILPAFDEFLVGYTPRGASIDGATAQRIRGGGIVEPVVVRDGRVVATWGRRAGRREVVCSVRPLVPLDGPTSKGLRGALQRYARFLGLDLVARGVIRSG